MKEKSYGYENSTTNRESLPEHKNAKKSKKPFWEHFKIFFLKID